MIKNRPDFLIIAHITDLHLRVDGTLYNGDQDTQVQLTACINHLTHIIHNTHRA